MILKNITLLFIFYLLFLPSSAFAEDTCNTIELNKLKTIANASKITYQYIDNFIITDEDELFGPVSDSENRFLISANNLSDKYYILSVLDGKYITYDINREVPSVQSIRSYVGGINLIFEYYASDTTACPNVKLKSSFIKLPKYNAYSKDKLCKGIEEYELCNKWYSGIIDKNTFANDIAAYKKSVENGKAIELEKGTVIDSIINFVSVNYLTILVSIIIIGILGIVFTKYFEKRSSKL